MRLWTTSGHKVAASIALFCLIPTANALATVQFTEVMYDAPGVDTGREWIQLTNTGTEPVNLAGYRLYEGGVNHKLTLAVGTSTLAAGAEAVITTDPSQYASDYPAFGGAVFKSSFSLSNTGETIALKDASLKVVDTYSYTAPPVVKEPVLPKTSKTSVTKKSTQLASTSPIALTTSSEQASPATSMGDAPLMPNIPSVWFYVLGLGALIVLGVGATLYAMPAAARAGAETSRGAEEFELE